MVAALVAYSLVIGTALSAVAALLDRIAALHALPRRWTWTTALALFPALVVLGPTAVAVVPQAQRLVLAAPPADTTPTVPLHTSSSLGPGAIADVAAAMDGLRSYENAIAVSWLSSSALFALVLLVGRWKLGRRRRHWTEVEIEAVPLLLSADVGPAVVGVLRPRIVLPRWALDLDQDALRTIVRHEREHMRAGDPLTLHVAALVLAAFPWHPAVWWMVSRLRLALEVDCDTRVLTAARHDAQALATYSELLLTVATQRRRRLAVAPALVESRSQLSRRIAALFPGTVTFKRSRTVLLIAAAGLASALILVTPVPQPGVATTHEAATAPRVPGETSAPQVDAEESGPALQPAGAPRPLTRSAASRPASVPNAIFLPDAQATALTRTTLDPGTGALPTTDRAAESLVAPAAITTPVAAEPTSGSLTAAIIAPQPITLTRPAYTADAMRADVSGRLGIKVDVNADGTVDRAEIVQPLYPSLDRAALEAARAWRFQPATRDGQPVAADVTVFLAFAVY